MHRRTFATLLGLGLIVALGLSIRELLTDDTPLVAVDSVENAEGGQPPEPNWAGASAALSDPESRREHVAGISNEVELRDFSGHVKTTAGNPVANGAMVILADKGRALPTGKSYLRIRLGKSGAFAIPLPMAVWPRDYTTCNVFDAHGRFIGRRRVRIGRDIIVYVPDPADPGWFVTGSISFEGVSDAAVSGRVQVQAEGRPVYYGDQSFRGNPAQVQIRLGLAHASEIPGAVILNILDSQNVLIARTHYKSIIDLRDSLGSGIVVGLREVDCTVPRLPSGSRAQSVKIAGLQQSFDKVQPSKFDGRRIRGVLGRDIKYRVLGITGETRAYGVLRDEYVEWLVSTPGPVTQEICIVDDTGEPVHDAAVNYTLLLDSGTEHGVFTGSPRELTDANGTITIAGLPIGRYKWFVRTRDSHGLRATRVIEPVPQSRLRVVLPRQRLVSLDLVFPNGFGVDAVPSPALHRAVVLSRLPGDHQWRTHATLPVGDYAYVREVEEGPREWVARCEPFMGHAIADIRSDVTLNHVAISMRPERRVAGELVDGDGNPVPGRWVSTVAIAEGDEPGGLPWSKVRADETGRFELVLGDWELVPIFVWKKNRLEVALKTPLEAASRVVLR